MLMLEMGNGIMWRRSRDHRSTYIPDLQTQCQGRSQTPQFTPVSNSPPMDGFGRNASLKFPNRSAQAEGLAAGMVKTPARFLSLSR